MDFVNHLIQEGYTEEEIGDILECMYIADNIDSLQLTEETILEGKGTAIMNAIKALKNMPKNPWVTRQIAKLQKLLKGNKSAPSSTPSGGFTSTRPGSQSYKPGGSKPPSGTKPSTPSKTGTGAAVATGTGAGLLSKIPNWLKGTAAISTGVLIGSQLPKDETPGDKDKESSTKETTTKPPEEKKPKFTMNYGWWKNIQPRGYSRDPGISAYNNVRGNAKEHFEIVADYLINEGHADTIEEAKYVMKQLDDDYINSILEEYPKKPIGYMNPSIGGRPIPYPPGHPKAGQPASMNDAERRALHNMKNKEK